MQEVHSVLFRVEYNSHGTWDTCTSMVLVDEEWVSQSPTLHGFGFLTLEKAQAYQLAWANKNSTNERIPTRIVQSTRLTQILEKVVK